MKTSAHHPTQPLVDLLPCPFCGAVLKEPKLVGGLMVRFHPGVMTDDDCLMSGKGFYPGQLKAWNRRPEAAACLSGEATGVEDYDRVSAARAALFMFMYEHNGWPHPVELHQGANDELLGLGEAAVDAVLAALTPPSPSSTDGGMREALERVDRAIYPEIIQAARWMDEDHGTNHFEPGFGFVVDDPDGLAVPVRWLPHLPVIEQALASLDHEHPHPLDADTIEWLREQGKVPTLHESAAYCFVSGEHTPVMAMANSSRELWIAYRFFNERFEGWDFDPSAGYTHPRTDHPTFGLVTHHEKLLGEALGRVLTSCGMLREGVPLDGPQLLLAAETFCTDHPAGEREAGAALEGRWRKKPVVIEAVRYGRRFDWPDWFHDAVSANTVIVYGTGKFAEPNDECFADINTLEGTMTAQEGDWIIRGIKGELYPCKPDIFAATYEPLP